MIHLLLSVCYHYMYMRVWNPWFLNVKLNSKPWQNPISVMPVQSTNDTKHKDTEGHMVTYEPLWWAKSCNQICDQCTIFFSTITIPTFPFTALPTNVNSTNQFPFYLFLSRKLLHIDRRRNFLSVVHTRRTRSFFIHGRKLVGLAWHYSWLNSTCTCVLVK